jgi:hypothetical protein
VGFLVVVVQPKPPPPTPGATQFLISLLNTLRTEPQVPSATQVDDDIE